jgi:hypothetical protein
MSFFADADADADPDAARFAMWMDSVPESDFGCENGVSESLSLSLVRGLGVGYGEAGRGRDDENLSRRMQQSGMRCTTCGSLILSRGQSGNQESRGLCRRIGLSLAPDT